MHIKLLNREWTMLHYALLECKIFGLKIWKCKIFDKYHVWLGLISLRPSNQGPVCMFVCLFVFFPLATFIRAKCRRPDAAIWGHWAQLVKDKLALQRRLMMMMMTMKRRMNTMFGMLFWRTIPIEIFHLPARMRRFCWALGQECYTHLQVRCC